jgi:hypothetical protein
VTEPNARLALSTPLTLATAGRREYRARLIRAGRIRYADNSPGPYLIPAEAIQEAVARGQLDSLPTFIDHAGFFESPSLRDLAGYVTQAAWNEADQAAEGTIRLLDTAAGRLVDDLFTQLLADAQAGTPMPDLGLSLVFWPEWAPTGAASDGDPLVLESFRHVESVDFVFQPAADGRILQALQRLSAALVPGSHAPRGNPPPSSLVSSLVPTLRVGTHRRTLRVHPNGNPPPDAPRPSQSPERSPTMSEELDEFLPPAGPASAEGTDAASPPAASPASATSNPSTWSSSPPPTAASSTPSPPTSSRRVLDHRTTVLSFPL